MGSGIGKSGKPCARLIASYWFAIRVISRMTDSVNVDVRLAAIISALPPLRVRLERGQVRSCHDHRHRLPPLRPAPHPDSSIQATPRLARRLQVQGRRPWSISDVPCPVGGLPFSLRDLG